MIRDAAYWREWEARGPLAEPVDYERNLRWFDAALEHARASGAWPSADPMEGLEEKIAWIAKLHGERSAR